MKLLRSHDYFNRNLSKYGSEKYLFPKPPTKINKRIENEITLHMSIDGVSECEVQNYTIFRNLWSAR